MTNHSMVYASGTEDSNGDVVPEEASIFNGTGDTQKTKSTYSGFFLGDEMTGKLENGGILKIRFDGLMITSYRGSQTWPYRDEDDKYWKLKNKNNLSFGYFLQFSFLSNSGWGFYMFSESLKVSGLLESYQGVFYDGEYNGLYKGYANWNASGVGLSFPVD
jgi:hypothetical protein